ncbi:DUF1360 domain-containing protein [Planomonospora corallina]|uniref:DUF1360 domain-containing protein n=1 Tax=Planomonospora corallina TaxID=1806052 RepID=A0ABV8IBB8_9ACTN
MITLVDLAVLALAGYRGTQLIVHDTILDGLRDLVFRWHAADPGSRARSAAVTLLSCVYCMGWWVCGAVLAIYLTATGRWGAAPAPVHLIEWFAVAGGAVLANRWDDTRPAAGRA